MVRVSFWPYMRPLRGSLGGRKSFHDAKTALRWYDSDHSDVRRLKQVEGLIVAKVSRPRYKDLDYLDIHRSLLCTNVYATGSRLLLSSNAQ